MPATDSGHNVVTAPGNSGVIRKTVQPNSKFPVTVIFIFHACNLRACSDLQVESYRVAGPLVDTLYSYSAIVEREQRQQVTRRRPSGARAGR